MDTILGNQTTTDRTDNTDRSGCDQACPERVERGGEPQGRCLTQHQGLGLGRTRSFFCLLSSVQNPVCSFFLVVPPNLWLPRNPLLCRFNDLTL
jgi:hypothetical protein